MDKEAMARIITDRSALIKVLVVGFLLGVCASVLGSLISSLFIKQKWWIFGLTALLLIFCIWQLSKKIKGSKSISIDGFVVYSGKNNSLLSVYRYDFSENISKYVKFAIVKNSALKKQWNREKLGEIHLSDYRHRGEASIRLLNEAAEYYMLDKLSTHLSDYFDEQQYDKSELKNISRENMPKTLLKNRILEIMSAPLERRLAFSDFRKTEALSHFDNVISFVCFDGFYSKFKFVLLKDATIRREDEGITISTSKFNLKMHIYFNGIYSLPSDFTKYYLKLTPEAFEEGYKITCIVQVHFKLFPFFKKSKWNEHAWVDSFFNSINQDMSGSEFFEKIGWETALSVFHCGEASTNIPGIKLKEEEENKEN